jgi:hypothetical protein
MDANEKIFTHFYIMKAWCSSFYESNPNSIYFQRFLPDKCFRLTFILFLFCLLAYFTLHRCDIVLSFVFLSPYSFLSATAYLACLSYCLLAPSIFAYLIRFCVFGKQFVGLKKSMHLTSESCFQIRNQFYKYNHFRLFSVNIFVFSFNDCS